ncbi:MAG: DNA gyrase subunit A, partial [Nanoarchaeota archaeon]|nr:DNA gyrase subunit A [Nanoarchaeota archaeon]
NFAMFSDKRLEFKKFYPKYNHRFKKISLPNYMDADIAFLLGALVSEGSFHQNKIIFNNSDMEFYGKVKKIILNKFKGTNLYERNIQGNCKELELYPQKAVKFLENIGLKNKKSKEKRIPFSVLNSKKEHIASFLKGLFEGDGSVIFKIDKRHKGKSIELAYHSKSIDLIKELKIILLSFGIVTTKPYKDKRFNCYKLQISGYESIFRFYTEIGFFSKRKQNELSKIKKLKSTRMSKTDFIPHLANYMRDKYPSQFLRKNNFDRYNLLIKNYNKLKIIIDDEDKILIDNIINFNYFFNAVKKIRKYKEETVYSIKVDSNCHSFVGNCFINHNTEARMQKITEELLADIEKDTVDFIPNYDGSAEEPTVLPAKVPNLLVNGSSGIAVGMATNMAPHNMNEICDAIISTVDNPEIEVSELLKIVPGPDFPTGGFICGRKGIVDAYNTGRGRLVMRAKTNVEENGDKKRIIVTEIPYQVNKASMIETIANNVRDKKIEGIRDIRDESDRVGMRVVFDLKKGFDPNVVLNQLYHNSQLQTTFGINNIALIGGQPKVMNLKDLIGHYIDHRKDILTRRTKFDLKKAEEKAHILEGLKIALGSIDSVIKTIKSSKDVNEAKKQLMSKFKLSDKQSQAILEMRLQKLTSLETGKINSDYDDTIKLITELKGILDSEEKIKDMIKSDLKGLKENFGDDRRTEILEEEDEIELEDMIPQEDVVVTVTHSGYIKKLPVTTYKKQKRGGKGVKGTGVKEEDAVEHLFTTSNHNYILFFTNKGKVHWLKAYQIPTASRYSRGKAIINLLFLGKEERVTALVPIQKFDENHFLLMATKKGLVKKTALSEFSRPRRGGIAAIKLKEGDELVKVLLTPGTLNIIVATKKGMAVKFNEKDVSAIGRTGMGVKGIKLKNRGDEVVGMEVALDAGTLLTVTENGFGKRTDMDEYTLIRRGGSGVINIKTTERNGDVVGVKTVQDSDEILIITKLGQMIRVNVKDISKIGRATQGVRVMRLDSGDKVTTIARVVAKSEE